MPDERDDVTRVRRTLEGVLGVPATEGNRIDVFRNGDEIFPALFEAIEGAENTIDFLTFVYWQGEVGTRLAEALAKKAQAGVRVRVLLDGYGARPIDPAALTLMDENDVTLRWFRPIRRNHPLRTNHRTHRKVMVVDEAQAFTGGVGIADEWKGNARNEHEWRDTHFRVEGPAVDGLRAAFLDNWVETDPAIFDERVDRFPQQPQPGNAIAQCIRGASETGWSDAATLFRSLLQLAERRVHITTAYFVPDETLEAQLIAAADRGVEIQILLPGPHADKRFVQLAAEATYGPLLEHGIHIASFQPSMLHAKVMTVDGTTANIGSANFNSRSMALDEEINVLVLEPGLVRTLDAHFDEDRDRSVKIEPVRWSRRDTVQKLYERAVRPLRRFS